MNPPDFVQGCFILFLSLLFPRSFFNLVTRGQRTRIFLKMGEKKNALCPLREAIFWELFRSREV